MGSLTVAIAALAALLPITNPLGGLAVFGGLTGDMEPKEARRQGIRTGIFVFAILGVFALLGPLILKAFGIDLAALQIAGGLVVAQSGFSMISPSPRLTSDEQAHASTKKDISFSPMALPMIAAGLLEVTEPEVVPWDGLPQAHQAMWENRHTGSTYVVNHALPELGLRSRDALLEAWAALGAAAQAGEPKD